MACVKGDSNIHVPASVSLGLWQSGRPARLPLRLNFSSAAECEPSGLWAMSPALVTERN